MIRTKTIFLNIAFLLLFPFIPKAQEKDAVSIKQKTISEARYLKSIYKTDKAITLLSGLLRPDCFDEELLSELADCHMQAGDYESAASTYRMLQLHAPDNILYSIKLMGIYYRLKDYPSSAEYGKSIIRKDTIPAILSMTGDSFNMMDKADSALAYYELYLRVGKANPAVVSKAAKIYLDRGDYDTVLSLSDQYLQTDSSNMDIRGLKGLAYYLKQEYPKSEQIFQEMADEGNDSYNVHYYLGQNLWHNNKPSRARSELIKAWEADSSDVNLAYTIGAVTLECGKGISAAEVWLDKAVELITPDPVTLARIYREYASGYLRSEQFKTALDYYLKSWELDKERYSVLSSIAYCHERLKEWKLAEKYYLLYLKHGKVGSSGYAFAQESLEYVKQQLFMEEP